VAWEGAQRCRVDVTLLSADRMRRLNRRATGRRGLTDVIAYVLPLPDGTVQGDIYICPAGAQPHAGQGDELVRLAVHGALHVVGYDHPAGPGRTRSAMWRRQERYMRRLQGGSR
jgi:rRNA maturation RNase YbeY